MRKGNVLGGVFAVISAVGVVASLYFCAKETPEAKEAIDEAEAEFEESVEDEETEESEEGSEGEDNKDTDKKAKKFGFIDKVKKGAPHYKKTIAAAGITILAISVGHIAHMVVLGSAVAAGAVWKQKYLDIDKVFAEVAPEERAKVKEILSKEGLKKKLNELKKKQESPVGKLKAKMDKLNNAGNDDDKFYIYEDASGQLIETTKNRYMLVKNTVQEKLVKGDYVSVDSIVVGLGGKHDEAMKDIGWSSMNSVQDEDFWNAGGLWLDMKLSISNGIKGDEVLLLTYNVPPRAFDPREFHI